MITLASSKFKRIIALTLALIILNAAIFPTITWALGSGVGQPEYSSFEPVDATDMVNLLTGDFTYNIPILNVPGPEGGYPLSMFYHAGISPEQEASWLGLGWNLNPGSINRQTKGIPDDWKGKATSVISYNEANTAYDWAASVNYQFSAYSVGFALDGGSYKSTTGCFNAEYGYKLGEFKIGGDVSIGQSGVGLSTYGGFNNGFRGQTSLNIDYSGNVNVNTGIPEFSSVGVSLSSQGRANGYASVGNQTIGLSSNAVGANDITIKTFTAMGIIPYENITFTGTYNHYTYWLWKMENKHNFGSLYMKDAKNVPDSESGGQQASNYITDSYSNSYNAWKYNNAEEQAQCTNLTFPNYDDYIVSGQGIQGNISPKILEYGTMPRESITFSKYDDGISNTELRFYNKYDFSKCSNKIYFQFDYDPSGYSKVTSGTYSFPYAFDSGHDPLWFTNFSGGSFDHTSSAGSFYNSTSQRSGKSKYIEWFSNSQIAVAGSDDYTDAVNKGFIESESQVGKRSNSELYDADGIGAFSITAEDGKTYHYSVPVYQFEEFQVFFNKNNASGQYIENRKLDKYAYDWLLTSITGPDYVDRGTLGVIDDADYGYWVKFDYGKWTDGYVWKNPYQDDLITPESANKPYGAYSYGRKQIYYLNDIKTKTHTAYFVKSLRKDGIGKKIHYQPNQVIYVKEDGTTWSVPNGYYHKRVDSKISTSSPTACGSPVAFGEYHIVTEETEIIDSGEPNYQLKLDKIILLNNSDAASYEASSGPLSGDHNGTHHLKEKIEDGSFYILQKSKAYDMGGSLVSSCDNHIINKSFTSYYEENILDKNDVQDDIENIESKALKVIELNQDYSLCGKSPNSLAKKSEGDVADGGKLTLNSVKVFGLGKADILPQYNFSYNNQYSNPILYSPYNIDDWGYYSVNKNGFQEKVNADAWSLNEIETPLGGKIKVNYEPDSYSLEAAIGSLPEYYRSVQSTNKSGSAWTLKMTNNINELNSAGAITVGSNYKIKCMLAKAYYDRDDHHVTYVPAKFDYIFLKLLSADLGLNTLTFENTGTTTLPIPISVYFTNKYLFGGGIRVKEVLLDDGVGNSYKTAYSYNNPTTTLTSGVTSFAPTSDDRYIPYVYELPGPMVMYEYVTVEDKGSTNDSYIKTRYKFDVLKSAQNVKSTNFSMGDQLKVTDTQPRTLIQDHTTGTAWIHSYVRSGVITDNKAAIGRILEVTTLNKANLVSDKVTFDYYQLTDTVVKRRVVQETFNDIKRYINWHDNHTSQSSTWNNTSSSRITYPNLLKSITTESNGLKNTITNTQFDFYSGAVTETKTENSNGEKYLVKMIPAYKKYSAMGSKVVDITNKNMLVQEAESKSYVVDGSTNKLIGASVQTWKGDDWKYRDYSTDISDYDDVNYDGSTTYPHIWRKYQNYVLKSSVNVDGTISSSYTDFNFSGTNPDWLKTNEITRYDHYSTPLESKDNVGIYSSVKKGGLYDNFVIASSGASNYRSFTHTSFEDLKNVAPTGSTPDYYFGGEVNLGDGDWIASGDVSGVDAHTGKYLVRIPAGGYGPAYRVSDCLQAKFSNDYLQQPYQLYRASVWVHKNSSPSTTLIASIDGNSVTYAGGTGAGFSNYQAMGIADSKAIHVGDWILLTVDIPVPTDYIPEDGLWDLNDLRIYVWNSSDSQYSYIDDMRLQPIDSPVTGYVYCKETGQLKAVLDNENFATKYTYDEAGRLIKTEKETLKGVKTISETDYNYGRK